MVPIVDRKLHHFRRMILSLALGIVGVLVACILSRMFTQTTPVVYYIPAGTFKGPRRGYVFTTRDRKTGYYRDDPH